MVSVRSGINLYYAILLRSANHD